jgi:hypothetical protein
MDTTKHSLNVHLEAREIRGEIEPTDNVQGNTREVEYVLKAKELCANIYGMTFPMRYATNMKNMKGFVVYKTKKFPTKANKRPSSLHQKTPSSDERGFCYTDDRDIRHRYTVTSKVLSSTSSQASLVTATATKFRNQDFTGTP